VLEPNRAGRRRIILNRVHDPEKRTFRMHNPSDGNGETRRSHPETVPSPALYRRQAMGPAGLAGHASNSATV